MGSAHASTIALAAEGAAATAAGPTSATAAAERYGVSADADFSMLRMCPIRHNYHQHPLMQLDRLEQLARSVATTRQCRFIIPGSTETSKLDHTSKPADGRSIDEVFARIHEPGSWVALFNVQTDPAYRDFLWEVLKSSERLQEHGPPLDVRGFIFISAPPSVTPFHIDRENNFWLQIRGHKKLSVWDHRDRQIVAARDVEDFISCGKLDNVRLTDQVRPLATHFDCLPGDGVYFPSTSPHMTSTETSWITADDDVVISIGVVFYTKLTRRNAYVHAFNHVLRRFGMDPRIAGSSGWIDRVKYPFGRVVVALKRRLRRYVPPPGF